ncbi:uncharacterized protein LOC125027974 [Penaeus chinensis]|uniref:uncharacterized protein LOC125027974 n=1 Tax=Penaeus chinensis TaxID=139456 RepID=UPI001FB7C651|nr:uncharacterized protein LOC125027974 [Penaeus chinensis]
MEVVQERSSTTEQSWRLEVGAEYESFAEFEEDLKAFSDHNFMLFVKAKSTKFNRRDQDGPWRKAMKLLPEKLIYKYIRYKCKHGGKRRIEGRGIRPNQRSFKLSCGAFLVLAMDRKRGKLCVTQFSMEHNHEVSEAIYKNYPENRRLMHPQGTDGEIFLNLKIDPTMDRAYLNEFSGKRLTIEDIYRMKQCLPQLGPEDDVILSSIETLLEEDEKATVVLSVKDKVLDYLYAQRSTQKKELEEYPDSVFMDVMCKIKNKVMPIVSLMAVDNKNQKHVIAQALVQSSQREILMSVLEVFKSENENLCPSLSVSNLMKSYEDRTKDLDYKVFLDKTTVSYSITKLVKEMRDVSTDYAFELMIDELKESKSMTLEVKAKDKENYEVIDNIIYSVTISQHSVSCSCSFYANTNLLCRHLFYLVSEIKITDFHKEWIPVKWQVSPKSAVTQMASRAKASVKIKPLSPEKVKKMRKNNKFLEMLRVMKLMANMNSILEPREYCARFELLIQLHKLWQDGKRASIDESVKDIKWQEMNRIFRNLADMSSYLEPKEYKDRYDLLLELQALWQEGKKVSLVEYREENDKNIQDSSSRDELNNVILTGLDNKLEDKAVSGKGNKLLRMMQKTKSIKTADAFTQVTENIQEVLISKPVKHPVCNKSKSVTQLIPDTNSLPTVTPTQGGLPFIDMTATPNPLPIKNEIFTVINNVCSEKRIYDGESFHDSMVIYLEPNTKPDMRPAVQVVVPPSLGFDDITVKMEVNDPPLLVPDSGLSSVNRRNTKQKLISESHNDNQSVHFTLPKPGKTHAMKKEQVLLPNKRKVYAGKELKKKRRLCDDSQDFTARMAEVNRFIDTQSNKEIQDLLEESLNFNYTKVQDANELKHRCQCDAVLSLVDEMQNISNGRILEAIIVAVIQRCKILNVNPKKSTAAYVLGASLLLYSYIHNLRPIQTVLTLYPLGIHEMSSPQPQVYSEDIHIIVGNMSIRQQSLQSLSPGEHLDDQVIHAYLGLRAKLRNVGGANEVFIFPSQLANVWETGDFSNWLFRNVDLSSFKWLLIPVKTEKHWFLLAGNVKRQTVTLLDSLYSTERRRKYFTLWKKYMMERARALGPTDIKWRTCHTPSTQQQQAYNCGVFILMNADALLLNVPTLVMRNCHANNYRSFVLNQLLKHGQPVCEDLSSLYMS